MDIGIDVGTVALKGANVRGEYDSFPSHVAVATEPISDDVTRDGDGFTSHIRTVGRDMEKYFVGDLALPMSSRSPTVCLNRVWPVS